MIERDFVARNKKEFLVERYIASQLNSVGLSHSKIQRTPLGEKITIHASRPGLIIGGGGSNIKKLTRQLKKKFSLENPQIEITEIADVNLVATVVAERIKSNLERYGTMRFKGVGHKTMADVLGAGAKGVEILISGKIPSSRARTWRFYQGYLKKCGDVAISQVDIAYATAKLKSGVVGIKVSIMPPNIRLPDDIQYKEATVEEIVEPVKEKAVKTEKPVKFEKAVKAEKPAKTEKVEEVKVKKSKSDENKEEKSEK